ncbi:MAG: lauroyl acyltransferase [Rhodospirillaceae bacterium]|nr:MAG: lauroyl acyltransferase [Rhodospirillaceae bacterium]
MSRPDPSLQLSIRHRIEAAAACAFLGAMARLPIDAASALGGWLGRRIGPLNSAHRTTLRNLAQALPELNAQAHRDIAGQAWDNLGRTVTEYAVLPRLWAEGWRDRITVSGYEPLAALAAARKPAILFSGHIGNWETIPLALASLARPLTIVYRPPNNPAIDTVIGKIRSAYTAAMAPKGAAGARMIIKALDAGELVFMVVDQKINEGLAIPFFGRGAFTGPAIARLAMRFGCPVIPVRCERLDGCRFHVTVETPWTFGGPLIGPPDENTVRAALTRINARIEAWVRERPGQWLWMHRRWPK